MPKVALASLLALTATAQAGPQPVPKVGQCPSGYASGSAYCTPVDRRAPIAVPKVGPCPSGYRDSGGYCVETAPRR
jgi:hypothetical protein